MKQHLIALAVLGTLAGTAAAQSSVTVYGKLDLGVGKAIGSTDKTLLDAAGSRLGFRGQEDLGGGLAAIFQIEHRFDPAAGTAYAQGANASAQGRFWNGRASVGLKSNLGTVQMGRLYTPSYDLIQNQIDPFGGDTVAQLRDGGMKADGLYATRVNSSLRYDITAGALSAGLMVSDSNVNGKVDRPMSLGAAYSAGPLYLGLGYEVTGDNVKAKAKITTFGVRYNAGFATFSAGMSQGTNKSDVDSSSSLIGVAVPVGAGEIRAGYARQKRDDKGTTLSKLGLGYHHKLSARTKLYVDFGRDSKVAKEKTGYDLGIQHNF